MTEKMQSLVDEGKITQEQADEKLAKMQERFENGEHFGKRPHKGGLKKGSHK